MANDDKGLQPAYLQGMVTRIGPKQPRINYVAKWRKKRDGMTQEQLGSRMGEEGVNKAQVSNWENRKRKITYDVQVALAAALQIEPEDIFRDPDQPTPTELLRDASVRELTVILNEQDATVKKQALDMVKVLVGRRAS